jgi:hypothetical protein
MQLLQIEQEPKIFNMNIFDVLTEADGRTAAGISDLDPDKSAAIASAAIDSAANGRQLSKIEREAIAEYAKLFQELLSNPAFRSRLKDMKRMLDKSKPNEE